jgi:hypothetical protein
VEIHLKSLRIAYFGAKERLTVNTAVSMLKKHHNI